MMVGTILMAEHARYTIVRKIADGGMAEIFLATQRGDAGFERPVVCKRILAPLVADPQFRTMLIDEAHVAMSLNHSNIVQVLDLGQSKDRYFLVLELVDGWDLNNILLRVRNTGHPLPPEIALYIVAEVCRALAYAHGKTRDGKALGIVHRDVSPHNVLISEQGEVKLTDFGIAKALGRRETTGQGVIKGKLAFMSPEQASGAPLDARSDLFAVGTILYLMATGRRPFEAPTDLEAILRVQQCDFPGPGVVRPDLNPALITIIEKAMKAIPSDRYQTADALLVDLESAQRTVFQASGQTELKRWLAALTEIDGIPPITRTKPAPNQPGTEILDLQEGEDLIFDDPIREGTVPISPLGAAVSARSPAAALPPPVPTAALLERPGSGAITRLTSLDIALPGGRRVWTALALALPVGLALLFVGLHAGSSRPPSSAPDASPAPSSPSGSSSSSPPALPTATKGPPPTVRTDPTPAAKPVTGAAPRPDGAATPTPAGEAEEDEDDLLRRKEPDAERTVIGEDEEPVPKKNSPAASSKPPAANTVSVHVVSRPEGAVIKLKDRVFGRAPMNLRFRSGNVYELRFIKSGYVTTTKKFAVSRKKSQTVAVSLQHKPKRKEKSFLQRLFGG